jgi:hypothetical protein
VRAGLHTGECEVRGDDIGGIAVHIGARVSARAGANDVLVSRTLRDLVIGSGLEFEDRGSHQLKGVPGEWRLFAVASPGLRSPSVTQLWNWATTSCGLCRYWHRIAKEHFGRGHLAGVSSDGW